MAAWATLTPNWGWSPRKHRRPAQAESEAAVQNAPQGTIHGPATGCGAVGRLYAYYVIEAASTPANDDAVPPTKNGSRIARAVKEQRRPWWGHAVGRLRPDAFVQVLENGSTHLQLAFSAVFRRTPHNNSWNNTPDLEKKRNCNFGV